MNKINNKLVTKVKSFIHENKTPIVILICGVNSIGKTTLAFNLSSKLEIKQRIGLGVIMKTLIANSSKREYKKRCKMDNVFSISTKELVEHESLIKKTVSMIVSKYLKERMSCIIEGLQLFSGYKDKNIVHFYIKMSDQNKYRKQLESGNTRLPRKISEKDFDNICLIDEFISKQVNNKNVYILENSLSEILILNQSLQKIVDHFNIK